VHSTSAHVYGSAQPSMMFVIFLLRQNCWLRYSPHSTCVQWQRVTFVLRHKTKSSQVLQPTCYWQLGNLTRRREAFFTQCVYSVLYEVCMKYSVCTAHASTACRVSVEKAQEEEGALCAPELSHPPPPSTQSHYCPHSNIHPPHSHTLRT